MTEARSTPRERNHAAEALETLNYGSMSDTVKIPRPQFPRNEHGPKGRVEHDSRGNAVWVRTRAEDSAEIASPLVLSIEDSGKSHISYPQLPASTTSARKRRR